MEYTKKRWITLTSTIPISICIGSFYAWSVFSIPLSEELNVSITAVTVAFTLSSGISGITNIIGGMMYDRYGPRLVLSVSGIFFASGFFLTGFSGSILWLYISFGVLNGIGLGIAYCTFLMNTANAFPDKRGMATGIIISGYGAGSFIFSPLANYFIENYGVLNAFKIVGTIVFVVIVVLAQFINRPPANFNPSGWNSEKINCVVVQTKDDKNWRQMLKDPLYYMILGMVVIATTAGLMIMGHGSAIAQSIAKVGPGTAAWIIGFVSVANAFGRFIWPTASDKIGRTKILTIIFLLSTVIIFSLAIIEPGQVNLVTIIMLLTGFCYGGSMGIFPSITTDSFGTKSSGMNFGFVIIGSTAGSVIGPTLASLAQSITGSYTYAFIIAASLCLCGVLLSLVAGHLIKERA